MKNMRKSTATKTLIRSLIIIAVMGKYFSEAEAFSGIEIAAMPPGTAEISQWELVDKIRGGLLGQILGNLNGIPHEMKYIHEPGKVDDYIPSLPEGARTDDDTDFEWVYICEMQKENELFLSAEQIAALWQERINRRIWCSNQYARQLMDLGFEPPLTGNVLLNPWAEFNISGQFLCETFGLLGPGMPQTASRIGLNYTRVAIDGEPAQTTQLFNTMIAMAFVEDDLEVILDAGLTALDDKSVLVEIIEQVKQWYNEDPNDWKKGRQNIKEKFSQVDGAMRDKNGYELNTAATIAALLYGEGNFTATLQHAFNFGWDCDNVAATAGTILGVMRGYRWMMAQDWQIVDRYKNTTRDNMPMDETITSFADRLIQLAEKVILDHGGQKLVRSGQYYFLIAREDPGSVVSLYDVTDLRENMMDRFSDDIERDLRSSNAKDRARAAYLAIALGLGDKMRSENEEFWKEGREDLQQYEQVLQVLFYHSPVPAAPALQEKMLDAGLRPPAEREDLW